MVLKSVACVVAANEDAPFVVNAEALTEEIELAALKDIQTKLNSYLTEKINSLGKSHAPVIEHEDSSDQESN